MYVADLAAALYGEPRLEMMGSPWHQPRRLSDLWRTTGIKGGQLNHHAHALTRDRLAKKEHDAYATASKGWSSPCSPLGKLPAGIMLWAWWYLVVT